MRRIELTTALAAPADRVWNVLMDLDGWSLWGGLVTSAAGELRPGARWTMTLRAEVDGGAPRTMRPRFVSMDPPRRVVFETLLLGAWFVRLVHVFDVEAEGDGAVLRQSFEATGLGVPLLWPMLRDGMTQFDELGDDLARWVARGEG